MNAPPFTSFFWTALDNTHVHTFCNFRIEQINELIEKKYARKIHTVFWLLDECFDAFKKRCVAE